MTLEALNSQVEEQMCKLLKSLSAAIIITPDMMERVIPIFISYVLILNYYMIWEECERCRLALLLYNYI